MAVALAHVRSCASQDNNACYYVDKKIIGIARGGSQFDTGAILDSLDENEREGGSAGGTVLTKEFLSCRGYILRVFPTDLKIEVAVQGKWQAFGRVWRCLRPWGL